MSSLDRYAAEWDRTVQQRGRDALSRIREDAWGRFASRGFPTTRDEEWRFTSVTPIAERAFTLAPPNGADHVGINEHRLLPDASAAELVFVNGHYVHALSRLGALP